VYAVTLLLLKEAEYEVIVVIFVLYWVCFENLREGEKRRGRGVVMMRSLEGLMIGELIG
jgi:hypothetical protein